MCNCPKCCTDHVLLPQLLHRPGLPRNSPFVQAHVHTEYSVNLSALIAVCHSYWQCAGHPGCTPLHCQGQCQLWWQPTVRKLDPAALELQSSGFMRRLLASSFWGTFQGHEERGAACTLQACPAVNFKQLGRGKLQSGSPMLQPKRQASICWVGQMVCNRTCPSTGLTKSQNDFTL